ncbi:hypothetical protein K8I31_11225 [bacterium]|nr:hypothetical protein [bacterium]
MVFSCSVRGEIHGAVFTYGVGVGLTVGTNVGMTVGVAVGVSGVCE